MSGTLRAKGRHARPAAAPDPGDEAHAPSPSVAVRRGSPTSPVVAVRRGSTALAGAVRALWPASRRTRLALVGASGLTGTVAAALAAFAPMAPSGSGEPPKAVAVDTLANREVPAPVPPSRPARSTRSALRGDEAAMAFYESRDPLHAAHVIRVVWTGPMMRVYTDLPASDADSRTARALCETAAAYAETQDRIPEVFVHANRTAGYPVLANKMSATDTCRLDRVP